MFLYAAFIDCLPVGELQACVVTMIEILLEGIDVILLGEDWASAFSEDGLGSDPENQVSAYIKDKCEWGNAVPPVPWRRPTAEILKRCCWPLGFRFDAFIAFLAFPMERPAPKA